MPGNVSVNATSAIAANAGSVSDWFLHVFTPTLATRFWELVSAPAVVPRMLYIVTPMLVTLLLMEFYFGRYTTEELGWNTAVGNALVLIFVSVDLLKTVYVNMAPGELVHRAFYNLVHFGAESGAAISTLITALVCFLGLSLLLFNFFHWMPKKLAFIVSNSLTINLIAYIGIVLVYTHNMRAGIKLDWYTLLAALCLYGALWLFFALVHLVEPAYKGKKRVAAKIALRAPPPRPTTRDPFVESPDPKQIFAGVRKEESVGNVNFDEPKF